MYQQQTTLQDSNYKRIPELFSREDFIIMVNALDKCTLYPKDTLWREWMRARDKCVLALLYYMGLRPKEALSIRYDDFKQSTMSFLIRGTNNKQNKDRVMPICEKVVPYLKNLLLYGKKGDYLFPSFEDRSKPLSPGTWKRVMREKILKPSGLWIAPETGTVPRTRSYSLRASFGTRLFEQTGDLSLVALLLGHSDYRSLKKYIFLSQLKGKALENARQNINLG